MYDGLIFPAPKRSYRPDDMAGRLIHIPRLDHDTAALWLPFEKATRVLLYCHANAVDIGHMCGEMEELGASLKVHVLLVEFTGYGIVGGSASEDCLVEDVFAVYRFLTETMKFHPRNIIAHGSSIGTGPATLLAATRSVGALVLKTPFTSIKDCVGSMVGSMAAALVANRFPNIERIGKVRVPVLIIHGDRDEIVPYEHALRLKAKCEATTKVTLVTLPGAGHNNISLSQLLQAMRPFLESLSPVVADTPLAEPPHSLVCRALHDPPPLIEVAFPDLLHNSNVLVQVLMANCTSFILLATKLLSIAGKEMKSAAGETAAPSASSIVNLTLALYGSPWIDIDIISDPFHYQNFQTAQGRYHMALGRLATWSPGTSPIPLIRDKWFVTVASLMPHRALMREITALVTENATFSGAWVYDKLLFQVERYVRCIPLPFHEEIKAHLSKPEPVWIPPFFSPELARALREGLQEPLRHAPEPAAAAAIASRSDAYRVVQLPADIEYVNAIQMALRDPLTVEELLPVATAYGRFQKAFEAKVFYKSLNVPVTYEPHEGRKKGGDCLLM